MTEEQIKAMLAELIEEIDYDIYKEIFIYNEDDDINTLIEIVRKYINRP